MRVKRGPKTREGRRPGRKGMMGGDRSWENAEEMMGGAGLLSSHEPLRFPLQGSGLGQKRSGTCGVVPKSLCGCRKDQDGESVLTLEGSALPRHDVLDKGWERRRKSATALGPSQLFIALLAP